MTDFTERDAAAIREIVDTHIQSILDHNPSAFLATCADDITFLPPELPPLVGQDACRAFLEEFPTPATFTSKIDDVEGDGDLAFARGSATATFDDGTGTTLTWLGIHRRQPDGSWRMTRDIWNTDEPEAS